MQADPDRYYSGMQTDLKRGKTFAMGSKSSNLTLLILDLNFSLFYLGIL